MPLRSIRPRHIILCVLSALRYDGVGFARDRRFQERHGLDVSPETPTLDRLAEQGTWFSQAYSPASLTSVANACLLTSRYPSEHRIDSSLSTPLPSTIPCLSQMLADGGYRPLAGLDFASHFVPTGLTRGTQALLMHDDARAVELLSNSTSSQFLFMQFGDLHAPYLQGQDDPAERLEAQKTFGRLRRRYGMPELDDGYRQLVSLARSRQWPPPPGIARWIIDDFPTLKLAMQLEGDCLRTIYPLYQRGINAFDRGRLARFVRQLLDANLLDDTLLIVTSDHGEAAPSDNDLDHGYDLSDSVLHVPLMFSFPGVVHERHQVQTPVSSLDVVPTILDFAGVNLADHPLRGLSLKAAITGGGVLPADRGLYAENWRFQPRLEPDTGRRLLAQRALRTDRYKLVIQGQDLEGDTQLIHLVDQELNLERFVSVINHRFMGLANTRPLESWIKSRNRRGGEQGDVLSDVLRLAHNTLGRDRYRVQHQRRLRSYLADRLQHYYRAGSVDIPALVSNLYEAYFVEFAPESTVQKLVVLVQHHCHTLEDIMRLFEQLGGFRERYQLYDVQQDPAEEVNLFSAGLTVEQERDALAMEIMLLEAWLEGRGHAGSMQAQMRSRLGLGSVDAHG